MAMAIGIVWERKEHNGRWIVSLPRPLGLPPRHQRYRECVHCYPLVLATPAAVFALIAVSVQVLCKTRSWALEV